MKPNAPTRLKNLRTLTDLRLIHALDLDPSDVVRHEAAFILGEKMRDGTLDHPYEAFKALCIGSLFDPSVLVRHETALSLASFEKYGSLRILQVLLADPAQEVKDSAAYAIEEMGGS